jgi:hypothetical protein
MTIQSWPNTWAGPGEELLEMSQHIDRVKRAIEFGGPDIIPVDLTDIPFIYNAYGTLDPEKVQAPEGMDDFDSAWCTYHWTLESLGKNERGEDVRRDEWGCTQIVPSDLNSAYVVTGRPAIDSMGAATDFPWPSPDDTDGFFSDRKKIIDTYYADRFINGFLDPGPFLIAFEILGYENLLIKLHEDLDLVKYIIGKIVAYQKSLVPRFREMGAHMITIIDEVAGGNGMFFSPELFREHFLPMYEDLFAEIHRNNMYVSLLLDGDITEILGDLSNQPIDLQFFAQPLSTGLETIEEYFRDKRAVKLAVDMMETLSKGKPEEIEDQVDLFVSKFASQAGGLVFQALRWHRPEYDPVRVAAQIRAMNKYRGTSV